MASGLSPGVAAALLAAVAAGLLCAAQPGFTRPSLCAQIVATDPAMAPCVLLRRNPLRRTITLHSLSALPMLNIRIRFNLNQY
ncbi:hypothetical protein ACUXQ2_002979 [Cupriavidus metallidurans]